MAKRLLNSLKNNLLLKILSVVIAIVIWYAVVGYNDPVETASFSVRVAVTNESYIESGKQSYHIDDNYKTVTAYVRGNRSELRDLTAEDISVTADLTQIVDLSSDPVMVPLTATCPGFTPADITLSRQTIPIVIEVIANKNFPVTVVTGDSTPGTDYEVGSLTPDPEQIGINGPESIINNIDSVVAEIDVTGMTRDGTKNATIKLYDKSGAVISEETIDDDLTFDAGITGIAVSVDLWKKKSDVGFSVKQSGQAADSFHVAGITTTPETITVVGTEEALETLESNGNVITIPSEMVSVQGANRDRNFTIDLAEILPEGLRLSQNTAETVTVNVTILSDESKELVIDVDDVEVKGLASDLTLSYDLAEFTVRVEGPGTTISTLKNTDVQASIDLTGVAAGDRTAPVQFSLPADVSLLEEVSLSVHLRSSKDSSTESSGGT